MFSRKASESHFRHRTRQRKSTSSAGLTYDFELESGVCRGVAWTGFEPEPDGIAQPAQSDVTQSPAPRAFGELGAPRHKFSPLARKRHMTAHVREYTTRRVPQPPVAPRDRDPDRLADQRGRGNGAEIRNDLRTEHRDPAPI